MTAEGTPGADADPAAGAPVGHRVSDAEREAVADRLRTAGGEGRLDPEELDERLTVAYSARTSAELESLTTDLPTPPVPAPARAPVTQNEQVRRRLAAFITANVVCIGVWAASGAQGGFWPVWVLLGTGIGLVAALVHAFLGIEDDDDHGRGRERHRERHRGR